MDSTQIDNWYDNLPKLEEDTKLSINRLCSHVMDGPRYIDVLKSRQQLKELRTEDQARINELEHIIRKLEGENAALRSRLDQIGSVVIGELPHDIGVDDDDNY